MTSENPYKIIIVDQQRSNWEHLQSCIPDSTCLPFCFDSVTPCLDNFASINPGAMVFGDLSFHWLSRLVYHLKSINPLFPMLIVGVSDQVENFIDSNQFQNIFSLSDKSEKKVAKKSLQRLVKLQDQIDPTPSPPLIVGESPEIQKMKKIINEAVRSTETVLITGEPGSGKDLVANVIHHRSSLNTSPIVKINVLAISKNRHITIDFAQYLDYEINRLQMPEGNHDGDRRLVTVLFDGIEHLTPSLQKQVNIFLNQNIGLRKKTDVSRTYRVLSTSRISFRELTRQRRFDNCLEHKLSVYNIKIPPLRRRREDISLLTDFFCDKFSLMLSKPYFTISNETKEEFSRYAWPENIREFESSVKQIVVSGQESLQGKLPVATQTKGHSDYISLMAGNKDGLIDHIDSLFRAVDMTSFSLKYFSKQLVSTTEKRIIKKTLGLTKWNRRKAAQILDISYKSLLNKIKDYEICR